MMVKLLLQLVLVACALQSVSAFAPRALAPARSRAIVVAPSRDAREAHVYLAAKKAVGKKAVKKVAKKAPARKGKATPLEAEKKPLETKYIAAYGLVAFGILYDFFVTHGGVGPWDPNYVP
mmetsp:Transcript_6446/g.17522  ORF Transcript_6446/g.17522 Transcript_6446/m.17522 type:complete len:121 (+) Transcript_6446:10-372(+)